MGTGCIAVFRHAVGNCKQNKPVACCTHVAARRAGITYSQCSVAYSDRGTVRVVNDGGQ